MATRDLTAERLRELLAYDPETGLFRRLVDRGRHGGRYRTDTIAGSLTRAGYLLIGVDGGAYMAHRLAALYMTGRMPDGPIDHINGAKSDNRWRNIRCVTVTVNLQNKRHPNKNNTTGLLGVTPMRNLFQARIGVIGKKICLGTFSTPEEAHAAYLEAKRRLHPGCTI